MLSPLLFISCFANVHGIATTDRSLDHDVPGKVVIKANPEKFHPAIDIRGVRKIYNVGHWENADHLTTQLNVLLRTLADHIEAKNGEATSPKVFPEYCSAGVHRCDGAAKCTACQVLNKVSSVGGGGRLCGAEVFSCSNVGPNRLAKTVFEEATKWTRWTVARGKNWASAASDASSRAYKQLEWINGLARLMSGVGAASLDVFTRGPLVDDLSASSCEKDVTFVAADGGKAGAQQLEATVTLRACWRGGGVGGAIGSLLVQAQEKISGIAISRKAQVFENMFVVCLAQGISEKGAGKVLGYNELMTQLLRDRIRRGRHAGKALTVLFCADGICGDRNTYDVAQCVECKVLKNLVAQWLPDWAVTVELFSFYNSPIDMLERADIFYFKGFGGDLTHLLPIFGHDRPQEIALRIKVFQEKIVFGNMLSFLVCGAAVLCGSHYPARPDIRSLKLFGDAYIVYHACETSSGIEVTDDPDIIQLVPGVANIIACTPGRLAVDCPVVAKSHKASYETFATASEAHVYNCMRCQVEIWRTYYYLDLAGREKYWACRTDGLTIHRDPHLELLRVLKEKFGEAVLAREQLQFLDLV